VSCIVKGQAISSDRGDCRLWDESWLGTTARVNGLQNEKRDYISRLR
jgi:hypothetical protein